MGRLPRRRSCSAATSSQSARASTRRSSSHSAFRSPRRADGGDTSARGAVDVDALFREEWGRAVSILIRVLGDFGFAEDAVQEDAFAIALERWPRNGTPDNPGAWIVTTARNRAIDRIRRERTLARKTELLARLEEAARRMRPTCGSIPDERLSLVFTCCHPALAPGGSGRAHPCARSQDSRTPGDRARVSSVPEANARTAARSREAQDPRRRGFLSASRLLITCCPSACGRCSPFLYLVFNEGYSATAGEALVRGDLCDEAIRLAKPARGPDARRGGGAWACSR